MRTPNAEHAEVPAAKITHYLLALDSEDGQAKAIFFLSQGFTLFRWRKLADALRNHISDNDYSTIKPSP